MRMFLLGCIALFILVIVTAAIKAKNPNKQATRRNRREAKRKAHPLGSNPLDDVAVERNESMDELSQPIDADVALGLKAESVEQAVAAEQAFEKPATNTSKPIDYVVLYVMAAKEQQFGGYELLQALLSRGLRFGKQKIFHRFQQKNGQGEKLFSIASANQPGTFDLPNMNNYACPGLTLFFVVKDVSHPEATLDLMLRIADQLAGDLGGEVWSEQRQVISNEEVDELRLRVAQTGDLLTGA